MKLQCDISNYHQTCLIIHFQVTVVSRSAPSSSLDSWTSYFKQLAQTKHNGPWATMLHWVVVRFNFMFESMVSTLAISYDWYGNMLEYKHLNSLSLCARKLKLYKQQVSAANIYNFPFFKRDFWTHFRKKKVEAARLCWGHFPSQCLINNWEPALLIDSVTTPIRKNCSDQAWAELIFQSDVGWCKPSDKPFDNALKKNISTQ